MESRRLATRLIKQIVGRDVACLIIEYLNYDDIRLLLLTVVKPHYTIELAHLYAKYGFLELLQDIYKVNPYMIINYGFISHYAIKSGCIEIIKWLNVIGYKWTSFSCSDAAIYNQLEILKYLHANGAPWDTWTIINATDNGHLEFVKWAEDNGCPFDSWIYYSNCNSIPRYKN